MTEQLPAEKSESLNSNAGDLKEKPKRSLAGRFFRFVSWLGIGVLSLVAWLWCVGFGFSLDDNHPAWIANLAMGVIGIGVPFLFFYCRRNLKVPLLVLAILFCACFVGLRMMVPSHDRDWGDPQAELPFAEFKSSGNDSELVTVNNIRALRYGPIGADGPKRYSDTFDLSKLKGVWFGVDRFTTVEPLAHTFLSFEFEPGSHKNNFLAFSVETRREKDEMTYSPVRGMFNNYEVIYVIADEEDVLSVRSDVQENVVQLYPMRATKQQVKEMFVDMLERANGIKESPEFYHTLTSNCTNNIVSHTNQVLDEPISAWQQGVVFPGYSDWLAYQLGIIDTDLSLTDAREEFRIDQRVKAYDGKGNFSEFIRGR